MKKLFSTIAVLLFVSTLAFALTPMERLAHLNKLAVKAGAARSSNSPLYGRIQVVNKMAMNGADAATIVMELDKIEKRLKAHGVWVEPIAPNGGVK